MSQVYRIAVVGSRDGINPKAVEKFIGKLNPVSTVLISGGARGVDTYAADAARERGIRVVEIRPNWKKYGRGAGFKRNKEIVLAADDVAAFWNGISKGTEHTIKQAVKLRRQVAIFGIDGDLIRIIEPGAYTEETMAIPRGRSKYQGPAQPPAHPGRPERTERRKQEARDRRDARRITGRLQEEGVWLPEML